MLPTPLSPPQKSSPPTPRPPSPKLLGRERQLGGAVQAAGVWSKCAILLCIAFVIKSSLNEIISQTNHYNQGHYAGSSLSSEPVLDLASHHLNASLQKLSLELTTRALNVALQSLEDKNQSISLEESLAKISEIAAFLEATKLEANSEVTAKKNSETVLETAENATMRRTKMGNITTNSDSAFVVAADAARTAALAGAANEYHSSSRGEQQHSASATSNHAARMPLNELVKSPLQDCSQIASHLNVSAATDTILPESITHVRKIPKIVHITSKARCMSQPILDNLNKWRFPDHSLYYHDDEAVERLLNKEWPEFPQLKLLRRCMVSGAAMADLWRYLVLWEYGGIYTDIDSCPGPLFHNGTAIQDSDDAWVIVERGGFVSQYFIAASPRHPFMHLAITTTLENLLSLSEVGTQDVPRTTGPGALKTAFVRFNKKLGEPDAETYGKPKPGVYKGPEYGQRSVTVLGTRMTGKNWVWRECLSSRDKREGYHAMGQKHFHLEKKRHFLDSCAGHLYKVAMKQKVELDESLKHEALRSGLSSI